MLGDKDTLESELFGFTDSLFNAVDRTYLSTQSHFTCHAGVALHLCIHVAGQDGADDRQVDSRVVDLQSAGYIEKDIFLCQLESDPFLQHGKKHVHSSQIKACGGALRIAVDGRADQCLCFDEERTNPFDGRGDGYAAHSFMVLAQQ